MNDNLIEQDPDLIIKGDDENSKKSRTKVPKAMMYIIVSSVLVSTFFGGMAGFLASEFSTEGIQKLISGIEIRNGPASEFLGSSRKGAETENEKITVVEEESATINVVAQASPAVVSIIVTRDILRSGSYFVDPFSNDPFFSPFGLRNTPQEEPEIEKKEVGGGTGFILSEDGYIITNRHVVSDDKAEYSVVTNNGDRYDALVLARDTVLDIAVIKIEAKDLSTINLGDSDKLKAGQTVIAIGNSLGEFKNTASKGIISGLMRSVNAVDGYGKSEMLEEVIQTDAAINPGNSGGPIVDLKGNVVGVNVAMAQGAENIGFAIPINNVKRIYQSVKLTGRIVRPYIGVRYMLVNKEVQEVNDLKFEYGAVVVRGNRSGELAIVPGSPADKAGILENDIILEIDGERIQKETDLSRIIRNKNVGDEVTLKVWSKDVEKIVTVKLEEAK